MSKLGKSFLRGLCQFVAGDQHQDGITRQQAHYQEDDKAENKDEQNCVQQPADYVSGHSIQLAI